MAYTLTYTLNSDGNSYTLSGYSGDKPTGELVIPDSYNSKPVTSIGNYAFRGCSGLTNVTIGNSVTSIGVYAFSDCTGLTSITIPDSVTSIGNSAFRGCTGLTNVTIGNSVTSIDVYAFSDCTGLTSIYYTGDITSWCGISGLNEIMSSSRTLYIGGNKVEGDLVIPGSVTSIGEYAFRGCSGLTSITIPNSVTSIRNYAFCDCTGLTSVTIGNSVTSIGVSAFDNCTGLTSVTIPNSVTSIGSDAFRGCRSLTSIEVADGNTKYHSNGNCLIKTETKTLILGCKTSVIPSDGSVTSIGMGAFYGCSGLTSVAIGNGITSIGGEAFYNCTGLTSVTIGNGVTSIGGSAFDNCTGLTSVTIGNGVTSIGNYAFQYCRGLTSITIPDSVTSIGFYAFRYCDSLTKINMLSTTPPTIQNNTLDATVQNIYVPAQSGESYKSATNWNAYADKITEFPILDLGSLLMYNNKVKAKIDTVKSDGGGVGAKGTGEGAEIFNSYEGEYANVASGKNSHAEGYHTKASGENQHVQGKFNIEDTANKYAHIVGNGESDTARSNVHTLDWSGNAWYAGKVSGGTEANPAPVEKPNDYVTLKHFDDNKIEVVDNLTTNDATKALSAKQGVWLNDVNEALTAPIKVGDNLTAFYFDTQKTPDLSIFTYTLDSDFGLYTAGLIGLRASEIVGYLSAVKVNDTVYALIYENRMTGDISYLYVSDNIEYGGTSFSKGWQSFNNPFPVTSATVVDVDQTATKPWNGIWVNKKAFYARTDEIPAEPSNGMLTIQKNGTTVGTFGANQSENTTVNITVPTKVSQLQNDAGFTKNKGTVISVRVNGTTYTADVNGLVDLGTISGGTTYSAVYNEIY